MIYFQDKVFPYPEPTDDQQETLQMMIDPVERFFTEKGREIKGSIKKLYTNIDESLPVQRDWFPSPRLDWQKSSIVFILCNSPHKINKKTNNMKNTKAGYDHRAELQFFTKV